TVKFWVPLVKFPPRVKVPASDCTFNAPPRITAAFRALLPVTFVIALVTVNAFPKSANPLVLSFNHGTLNPLRSFVFVCRVVPLKVNALPFTGTVPSQLVRFDQFPLAPAPLHVRGPEFH